MTNWAELKSAKYVNLATFRKTGVQVNTPVWAAPHGETLYVFSEADAGKMKRLRNSSQAELAPCDFKGGLLGEWVDATAEIVDDQSEINAALAAFQQKYGWVMIMTNFFSRLSGKFNKRGYIRLTERRSDGNT